MKKQITIDVPNNWSAVTLTKYLAMYEDLKAYTDEPEAILATMFYHLCGVTPEVMRKLDTETFINIKNDLTAFVGNTNVPLVKSFFRNGIEYGFYPNLSKIEYGAYIDICKYTSDGITKDWAKVMAILYRPITKKVGKLYEVASYTGEEEYDWFMEVGMDIHLGAWFFFINLSMDLLSGTLNSLAKTSELPQNIKHDLEKSGEAIQQLFP
jgi:hypothetical protein